MGVGECGKQVNGGGGGKEGVSADHQTLESPSVNQERAEPYGIVRYRMEPEFGAHSTQVKTMSECNSVTTLHSPSYFFLSRG